MFKTIKHFKKRYIYRGSFGANVLTLMTGVGLAQILTVAIAPILTRIYTPADFGIFTVYMSVVSILALLSTGRYELAVMLPGNDEDAVSVSFLSAALSFFSAGIILLFLLVFKSPDWFYLVPPMVFLLGLYQALYYLLNRRKQYKKLAVSRIAQVAVNIFINIFMGLRGFGVNGLLVGVVGGQLVANGIMFIQVWRIDKSRISLVSFYKVKQQMHRYRRFPLFSLPADFINMASNQLPAILLNAFFGSVITGFFGLTQRILGVSSNLISKSVLDVFKERASSDYAKYGSCRSIYLKTLKSLFVLAVFPFIIIFFIAPGLFAFIFGQNWRVAGVYAQILSPMFFMRFICSPLSYILYIAEKQKYDLFYQIILFLLAIGSILIGGYLQNIRLGLICFSASYSLMYIFYLGLSYYFTERKGV